MKKTVILMVALLFLMPNVIYGHTRCRGDFGQTLEDLTPTDSYFIVGDGNEWTVTDLPRYYVATSDTPAAQKNLADYVGDGTDDDVEILAAINALSALGGTVELMPGTYSIYDSGSATGILLVSNMTLEMSQGVIVKLAANPSNDPEMFELNSISNVTIRGGIIDGNKSAQTTITGIGAKGFRVDGCTNILFDGVTVKDVGTSAADSGYGIYFNGSSRCGVHNCYFQGAKRENIVFYNDSNDNTLEGCNFIGGDDRHIVIHSSSHNTVSSNTCSGGGGNSAINVGGTSCRGNVLMGNTINAPGGHGIHISSDAGYVTITANSIYKSGASTTGYGIYIPGTHCTCVANYIYDADNVGIFFTDDYNSAIGNTLRMCSTDQDQDSGIRVGSGAVGCNVIANDVQGGSRIVYWAIRIENPTANVMGNIFDEDSVTQQQEVVSLQNTSGGTLVEGDVVIYDATGATFDGTQFTTTTTGGDDKILGMVAETIADNASGFILKTGKTDALKVDGTDDIAIGDFLTTFTTAKIGAKANAGDMAFAIALEAYTTNDSSGVIDAILIEPRKI